MLGVGQHTPTVAVLGQCGRYKLYIDCYIKCIKYWFKLLALPENSLLHNSYDLMYAQWENILCSYCFANLWFNQSVQNINLFMCQFIWWIQDCDIQLWNTTRAETPKLDYYNIYKTVFETELYLTLNLARKLRVSLVKFRTLEVII